MEKSKVIIQYLDTLLPNAECELDYGSDYQLLIAVILSAQCTDKRVNIVTKDLFTVAPTAEDMLNLSEDRLKEIIHSCGFYNSKAKSIIECSRDIIDKFGGVVPDSLDALISLRGVGRKTANVVRSVAFGQDAFAVDTHVLRISKRLGICEDNDDPYKCELKLIKFFENNDHSRLHHQLVLFGRYHCKSIKPNCAECKLKQYCKEDK